MKVLRKTASGVGRIALSNVATPEIGPDDVLMKVYIYRIPDHVSLDHACLAEPIVATHHWILERAQVKVGDDVVVVGPGPMGIMGCQYAKVCGARRVFLIGLKLLIQAECEHKSVEEEPASSHASYTTESKDCVVCISSQVCAQPPIDEPDSATCPGSGVPPRAAHFVCGDA